MQLTASNQYLIKNNSDLMYYFYLDNDKSLNYSIYDVENNLLETKQLVTSVVDFSVSIDRNNKIYLICITNIGDLLYYIYQNDSWNHKVISKFNIKSNIYRNLNLIVNSKYTHVIYTKTNLLTPMLSYIEHIYWSQSKVNKNIVGNYIHGKYPSPLQISVDKLNNLHLVYKAYYKNNYQLYYSRFSLSNKKWSINDLLTNLNEDNSHPYILIDRKDNLHLVWCTIEQSNFILKYRKKANVLNTKSKWLKTMSLSRVNSNNHSPILIQDNNTLKMYCKRNDQIVEITSSDFGYSWNVAKNNLYNIKNPKILRYAKNPQSDQNLLIKHVYGNVENNIEIVGINLLNDKDDIHTKDNNIKEDCNKTLNSPLNKIEETSNNTENKTEDNKKDNLYDLENPKPIYTQNEKLQPYKTINELLSNYKTLEEQLIKVEEEKKQISKTISLHEERLNLLDEKILECKKQLESINDNINKFIDNNSILNRFINFFK